MIRTLVVRGLLIGLLAGFVAGTFAFVFGEPRVDAAIALEEAAAAAEPEPDPVPASASAGEAGHDHAGAAGHDHGEEAVVGRPVQKAGLFLATGLYGLAVGGVFALVFAGLRGRFGPRGDGALALASAATAFVAVILVPFLKYPANPPAVGDPETINSRTALYVVMVIVGLAAVAVAVATARRVTAGPWQRRVAAGVAFLVPVVAAWLLLPTVDEVPEGFPASLLWNFRLASLGTQLVFWTAFGVLFGWVGDRVAGRSALSPAPSSG
ncbi:CbtA family protein [Streptosporangium sandarakinum]|uniref:CbtA family protein n=1 Tax=Streptosporangium sandarakinum TaxID=1260955 RepID=UPI00369E0BAA